MFSTSGKAAASANRFAASVSSWTGVMVISQDLKGRVVKCRGTKSRYNHDAAQAFSRFASHSWREEVTRTPSHKLKATQVAEVRGGQKGASPLVRLPYKPAFSPANRRCCRRPRPWRRSRIANEKAEKSSASRKRGKRRPPTPRFSTPSIGTPGGSEKGRRRAFDQPRFPLSPIFLVEFRSRF
jgi:hypothetical protein